MVLPEEKLSVANTVGTDHGMTMERGLVVFKHLILLVLTHNEYINNPWVSYLQHHTRNAAQHQCYIPRRNLALK